MDNEKPCIACKALIDSSAVEQADSAQIDHLRVSAEDDIDHYECQRCGSQLSHEHKRNGPSMGWRLLV